LAIILPAEKPPPPEYSGFLAARAFLRFAVFLASFFCRLFSSMAIKFSLTLKVEQLRR
jgi:hypothetical protein